MGANIFICFCLYSLQPEYKVADPICTFLFSVLVLGTTLPVTKDVFRILMEGKHTSRSMSVVTLSFDWLQSAALSVVFVFCRRSPGPSRQRCERAAAGCERSRGRSQFAHVEPQHDSVFTLCPRGHR